MKIISSILLLLILGCAIAWYGLQYLRTGHFFAYVNPPEFNSIEKKRVKFLGRFESYSSPDELQSLLIKTDYKLLLKSSEKEQFRDVTFETKEYSLSDFEIAEKKFNLSFNFFNQRLAAISICTMDSAENLFIVIQKEQSIQIERHKSFESDLYTATYGWEKDRGNCIYFNDSRLGEEFGLWSDLTQ